MPIFFVQRPKINLGSVSQELGAGAGIGPDLFTRPKNKYDQFFIEYWRRGELYFLNFFIAIR